MFCILSIASYSDAERIKRDQVRLLEQALEHRPFKVIATAVGFADPRAFRRAFKRWTGTTPQEFRLRGLTGFGEPTSRDVVSTARR
jgi:AraC-like DNA-binding protein